MVNFSFFHKKNSKSVGALPPVSSEVSLVFSLGNNYQTDPIPPRDFKPLNLDIYNRRATIYDFNQRAKPQTFQRKDYKHMSFQLPQKKPLFLEDERNMIKLDEYIILGNPESASLSPPPIPPRAPGRVATVNAIRILECKKRYLSSIPTEAPTILPEAEAKEEEPKERPIATQINLPNEKLPINDRLVRELSRRRAICFQPSISIHDNDTFFASQFDDCQSSLLYSEGISGLGCESLSNKSSETPTELSFSTRDDIDSLFDLYDITPYNLKFADLNSAMPEFDFTPVAPLAIPSLSYPYHIDQEIQQQLASMYIIDKSTSDESSEDEDDNKLEKDDCSSMSTLESMEDSKELREPNQNHIRALKPLFS